MLPGWGLLRLGWGLPRRRNKSEKETPPHTTLRGKITKEKNNGEGRVKKNRSKKRTGKTEKVRKEERKKQKQGGGR